MRRFSLSAICAFACAAAPARGDEPPAALTAEGRKALEVKWLVANVKGYQAHRAGKHSEAYDLNAEALAIARRLYPREQFPDGHDTLAVSLMNAGLDCKSQTKYAAAESLHKEALEMNKRLNKGDHPKVYHSLNDLGVLYEAQGRYADAEPYFRDALETAVRLFKGDHPSVATALNNLGGLYNAQGRYRAAEALYRDALEMDRRLFPGNHPEVALSLNNLAAVYQSQGKYSAAEPLLKASLEMHQRMFKRDHVKVSLSLNNLASLYHAQGKYPAAEALYRDALEMNQRLFNGDHPDLAGSLHNLAAVYRDQAKYATAEPLAKQAVEMYRRLFKGDHPEVANSLSSLAAVHEAQERYAVAEPLYRDVLEMRKRLFKGDHPHVAVALQNLAALSSSQGKYPDAERLCVAALTMSQRLTVAHARQASEGEALTFTASLPLYRDRLLSLVRHQTLTPTEPHDAAAAYRTLWTTKGTVARVYEQRHLRSRAAAVDPALAKVLTELAGTRRRRAEVLLAPATKDPETEDRRAAELKAFDRKIAELSAAIADEFPTSARCEKLEAATPDDLRKALPPDVAVVDYFHYYAVEFGDAVRARERPKFARRYAAFAVTADNVSWVDLHAGAETDAAVERWREGITAGKEIPAAIPAKVRDLVWEPLRKTLPAGIKVMYVCPDGALCKVPFGALPGDKPGGVVLDDFAVATIPHAPFLLDKLWPQEAAKKPSSGALVVGGVKYDAAVPAAAQPAGGSRGEPLVKEGPAAGWAFLDNTVGEANGFATAAARHKVGVTRLDGEKATAGAVLAALPSARYAHLATHGFFADPSFRGLFQLDERDFAQTRHGERIGRAANSPLLMTGLVFAGANAAGTAGRGIVTGEQLIDLDLSGLRLAVLSACETGVGDVAGGEGTFGLQRAFHYAGGTDVVASLWKVPDRSTAALMAAFYRNLWDRDLPPVEALRRAQLELYRNPGKIADLAKGFRGTFDEVSGTVGAVEVKAGKDGTAHPLLWAAFTLSGPGR
jgi:CHAT domain-containing protein/tetratricopeptide (TPR) repeat protein